MHILISKGGESGSADTVRDPRGFALKFYTDEGVWDLVGNNTPIFFIRKTFFKLTLKFDLLNVCFKVIQFSFHHSSILKREIHKRT